MATSFGTDVDGDMSRFISELTSYLEPYISHPMWFLPNLWPTVSGSMIHLSSWLSNPLYRTAFYHFVLNLFEKYGCKNINVIEEVFYLFHETKQEGNLLFRHIRRVACESPHMLDRKYARSMRHLFKVRYNALRGCCPMDPVRNAFIEGDLYYLETLLRYGVSFLPPKDDLCEWMYGAEVMKLFLKSTNILKQKWNFFRAIRNFYPQTTRQRIFMIILAMEAIARDRMKTHMATHIKCLEKIFDTIPEPFITVIEIRKFLCRLLRCEESDPMIYQATCDIEGKYLDGTVVYQPRSLKHLSRCAIRQSLREASVLPHCVDELQLPNHVEMYIKVM